MSIKAIVLTFSVVVLIRNVVTQINSTCTTPNGEQAKCVPARSCLVIIAALQTGNKSAQDFAAKSQCGHDGEPLVCCGSSGFLGAPNLFSFFTTPTTTPKPIPTIAIKLNDSPKELPGRTICGLEKEDYRIFGGEITEIGEFPWMAALEYAKKTNLSDKVGVLCGGSIINQRYVLTAAHCIRHQEFKLVGVRLGEWKISTDPDCEEGEFANEECADKIEHFEIEEEVPHEFYSKQSGSNDVGLLKLNRDIQYTDYIRPVCLPPSNLPPPPLETRMTVAGWGLTENNKPSDVKLKVEVPLLSNSKCKEKLRGKLVSANQLCAGGESGKDSCQGDSGGPLMRLYEDTFHQQKQWYQEGVVSRGAGCGNPGFPAIYTRISRYIGWILNNISDD